MAPLVVLLVVFVVAQFWVSNRYRDPSLRAARVALAAMFTLTGVAHFTSTGAMVQMLPPLLPGAAIIVYLTGVLELIVAAFLLWRVAYATPWLGWMLSVFLLALLPANIYSAIAEVGLGGHGASYLWFRIPLQVFFIGWALVATGAVELGRPKVAAA